MRSLLYLVVHSSRDILLPTYLHVAEIDEEWYRANESAVRRDVRRCILDNLELLERRARDPACNRRCDDHVRIASLDEKCVVSVTAATKTFEHATSSVMAVGARGALQPLHMASFSLYVWAFRAGAVLPTDY